MRKSAKYISIALILLIIVIVCKDQFEKNLMANSNYGMPSLIIHRFINVQAGHRYRGS
jgi:hypothetical protein